MSERTDAWNEKRRRSVDTVVIQSLLLNAVEVTIDVANNRFVVIIRDERPNQRRDCGGRGMRYGSCRSASIGNMGL